MRNRSTFVKVADDCDEPITVLFDVWRTARSVSALLDGALAGTGLDAEDFAVYSLLAGGPVSPTELARWMSAPATTVSSYVKRLQARGHVRRIAHPEDGRSYRLHLTTAGRQAHTRAAEHFIPALQRVEAAMTVSPAQAQVILRDLEHAVTTVRIEGSDGAAEQVGGDH